MYQPPHFQEKDEEQAFDFIEKFPFATLISSHPFMASNVPILMDRSLIKIVTHVSRRNELAKLEGGSEVIAIFQGPHAYISPRHYESIQSVPTWNYIAVHIKGRVLKSDPSGSEKTLMELVDFIEPDYKRKWQNMPAEFKAGLIDQMRPVEIEITSIEMTRKLSQNKSKGDRDRIIDYLLSTNDSNAHQVAVEMKKGI